jgi:hypothetical protein
MSIYGVGDSFNDALIDYVETIRGMWLVIDASGNNRQEFSISDNLFI